MSSTHKLGMVAALLLAIIPTANGQPFAYTNNDLALGFRKTDIHQESYEAIVNIGSATNYVYLQNGTTITVPNYSQGQLSPDTFSDTASLHWSVTGYAKTNSIFVLPGYVNNTLWLTVPRSSPGTQGTPPTRLNYSEQGAVVTQMKSILSGALYLSSQGIAGPDNTARFVREPVNNSANLSAFISSAVSSSGSTLRDTWTQDLETITPDDFSGTSIADFYEVRPTVNGQGLAVTDPHTGQTSGEAYYVGFFTLSASGSMTFTRGSGTVHLPPAAPHLSATQGSGTIRISFTTENGATYKLYRSDGSGLSQPASNWVAGLNTIQGDGTTKEFEEAASETLRFYRVSAE